jgi:hypothetical protein
VIVVEASHAHLTKFLPLYKNATLMWRELSIVIHIISFIMTLYMFYHMLTFHKINNVFLLRKNNKTE